MTREKQLAQVLGSTDQPLWFKSLGDIVNERAAHLKDKPIAIFPWQGVRLSYEQLAKRSQLVAAALIQAGMQHSDCISIMAGNRYEYLEVVIGGALIGCPVLVLNNTYKPWEVQNALKQTSCRMLFIAPTIGSKSLIGHIQTLTPTSESICLPHLDQIITFENNEMCPFAGCQAYEDFISNQKPGHCSKKVTEAAHRVKPTDVMSLQFTSGTTGQPKASMLTHINLLNNAWFLGQQMGLNLADIVCCPPPLFHAFGLAMGFLSTLVHSATIVFPSDHFDAGLTLDAISQEKCTTLLGVPTMFTAEMEALRCKEYSLPSLYKGLIAGSVVSPAMLLNLKKDMGIVDMIIAYGMTETGPITFSTSLKDSIENRTKTVGRVMPHVTAKIVNKLGTTLFCGERGELCISGYALQRGYYNNRAKTDEVMTVGEDGVVWMHTGDECIIDEDGYCHVLGRSKDIIIRGGENIFPKEIEEYLQQHPSVIEACVVGVPDAKYGEAVGCFLRATTNHSRAPKEEIQSWVEARMGRSRTPQYVFWLGIDGVCSQIPQTGSGKHQKHLLREMAVNLISADKDIA